MKTKSILISGASVAGPALAYWLNRYGFEVTILERAPGIRPGGYAVDFRGAAIEVLEKMNLLEKMRCHATLTGAINIVDKHNRRIARMPDGFTSGELEILRGDLANVLYDASRHDVEYIFNDNITFLREHIDGVEVTFEKHAPRSFDLVIGADGLHSNVRKIAFGNEAQFRRHLGLYFAIFSVPNFLKLGMDGVFYGTPGKRAGVFGACDGAEARATLYFASAALQYNRHDIDEQKLLVRERFAQEAWVVPELLEYMDASPDFYFDTMSQIKMERWHNGRIALVGDAAHCASPMSGLGTSMAIVGAYILAGELKKAAGDYTLAFRHYEAQMRPFVEKGQQLAEGGPTWFVPTTPFKHWLSLQLWKILPYSPWKNMMIEMPAKISRMIKPVVY
ncbi:FAD-dependent monooxygenase [Chitinophaga vietnamensis]|uniref:FAD-dependent monooxygenase n=1 Tax=Chitinophaga vietnamensis TaxID=2593957 RepID=UPI0011780340|nr:FAD-dependent monooxygenase [Chitinophaga vietnamensis]